MSFISHIISGLLPYTQRVTFFFFLNFRNKIIRLHILILLFNFYCINKPYKNALRFIVFSVVSIYRNVYNAASSWESRLAAYTRFSNSKSITIIVNTRTVHFIYSFRWLTVPLNIYRNVFLVSNCWCVNLDNESREHKKLRTISLYRENICIVRTTLNKLKILYTLKNVFF